jgi:hypothetical protein
LFYNFPITIALNIFNYKKALQDIYIEEYGGYINGRRSANLELLIDKTSSIYLYVKLKALAS